MRRSAIILFSIVVILITLIYTIAVMTINYEEVYKTIRTTIEKAGYKAETSSVEIVHFPVPKIIIGDININNVFVAKKLSIAFSVGSILTFHPTIESIEVFDTTIHVLSTNLINHQSMADNALKILEVAPNIYFQNVELIDTSLNASQILNSILIKPKASFNNIVLHWNNNTQTNISFSSFNAPYVVTITTSGPKHTFELTENYNENAKLVSGNINYKISSLKDHIDNVYPNLDLLFTKVISTENVLVSGNFTSTSDSIFFPDLNVISDSIKMTGKATLFKDISKKHIFNLNFDSLNLSNLLSEPDMSNVQSSKTKDKLNIENWKVACYVTANNIALRSATIKDFQLESEYTDKKIDINKLSFKTLDGGNINGYGEISQNQYRSKFLGKVSLTHPNTNEILSKLGFKNATTNTAPPLTLSAEIEASPIDYQLNNIFAKIGSFDLEGVGSIKLIGQTPRVNLTMNVSPIDLGNPDYPIFSPLISYFKSLSEQMQDKDYSAKYTPLRKLDYLGNFDITFTNPSFDHHTINKIHLISDISSGMIDLSTVYYQDGHNYFSGKGQIISSSFKPTVNLSIIDSMLISNPFSLDDILMTFINLNSKYVFNKIGLNFNIRMRQLVDKNNIFKDFIFGISNNNDKNNLWTISALNAHYNDGKFTSSGSLLLDSMTLNLAYAYNNFKLSDLNLLYPINVFGVQDGWISSNGTIVTTGTSTAQWIYNTSLKSNFVGKDIVWNNFDIDGFITATDDQLYNTSKIDSDIHRYTDYGTTNISETSGAISTEHGIIKLSDVIFNTKRATGSLAAAYNLYNSSIDATTKLSFILKTNDRYSAPRPTKIMIHATDSITAPKKEITFNEVKSALDARAKRIYNRPPTSTQGASNDSTRTENTEPKANIE